MCKFFLRIALVGVLTILNITGQAQERKTVLERLTEVRENHNVRFVYDSALNGILNKEYDGASIKGMKLDKALDSLLKDTGVTWSRQKDYIILTLEPRSSEVSDKRVTVSGYVLDSKSGESLIGAGVRSEIDGRGTVSNNYGFYSLSIPRGLVKIECSYVGYEARRLSLKAVKDTVLNIRLNPGNILSESSITARKEYDFISRGLSAIDIPIEQIRQTPSVLGEADILKTLQLLPGVQAGTNGFTGLYVRGGGPDENLLMLDGTALYNAEHMLGVFSIFMPDAVKKVTLYKGAFPARFGGRVSSVVDVRTNDGNLEEHKGSVSLSVLSSKVHFEGPIVKGRGSYSLSGRLMHSLLAQPFIKRHEADDKYNYWFYDLNGKLTYRLGYTDGSSLLDNTGNWQDRVVMGEGRSMGMELFIRKMSGKTTGWLSYTLAKTDRRFLDGSVGGADWYPYKYDRRHSAALVLNQKIGKKIDLSGTWTFSSGGVLSIPERQTVVLDPDSGNLHRADLFVRRGNYRLPSSHCLSIGMNYRKKKRRGERICQDKERHDDAYHSFAWLHLQFLKL